MKRKKQSEGKELVLNAFYTESLRAIRFKRPLVVVAVHVIPRGFNTASSGRTANSDLLRLRGALRRYDTVAQWRGPLYLCLCPEATLVEGAALAVRCRELDFVLATQSYNFPEHGRQLADIAVKATTIEVDSQHEMHSMGS